MKKGVVVNDGDLITFNNEDILELRSKVFMKYKTFKRCKSRRKNFIDDGNLFLKLLNR
jgi:hypothetical protein